MSNNLKPPAVNPCGSCPYRRDVPSGIWHEDKYRKLPAYDPETGSQPVSVFLCHQNDGAVCAGWCGTHNMHESLVVRFACTTQDQSTIAAILDYSTETPLFASGSGACEHGMRDLLRPQAKARGTIDSLILKRKGRA